MKTFLFAICFFVSATVFSQSITNTLGTGGVFTIKDSSTNFWTLTQSTGQVNVLKTLGLENTTSSSVGVLYKGSNRFLHNYGTDNTFLGINSGNLSDPSNFSTGLGIQTLTSANSFSGVNTAVGMQSLYYNEDGDSNTAVGLQSLYFNDFAGENTAVGLQSLYSNTQASYNTAVGTWSLYSNNALYNDTYNTAVGIYSMYYNTTTGRFNTALGDYSLFNNTTGYNNTAIGSNSLGGDTSGYNNTALGFQSLLSNPNGQGNTAVGVYSLYSNYGIQNTAVGDSALYGVFSPFTGTNGSGNTGIGYQALINLNGGNNNTAVGWRSCFSSLAGNHNTALGQMSFYNNSSGYNNTALGSGAMTFNATGYNNTAVGLQSLENNTDGYENTAVGYFSGSNVTTGHNLTLIGLDAQPTSGTVNNQITLSNGSVTSLRCNVTQITSLSDERDKKNIKDLSLGLDFLMKIEPRQFNWDKREWYDGNKSDGSKMKETPTAGFIAQELDEAQTEKDAEWLNLVMKDNPEKLEATYGNLLPVMVKAIQELKIESDKLKMETEVISSGFESLKSTNDRLAKLEKMMNDLNLVKHTSLDNKEELNPANNKSGGEEK